MQFSIIYFPTSKETPSLQPTHLVVEPGGALERGAGVHGAKVVKAVEDRAILADVEVSQGLVEDASVVWGYFLKKVDVLFRVKPAHVMIRSAVRLENLRRAGIKVCT